MTTEGQAARRESIECRDEKDVTWVCDVTHTEDFADWERVQPINLNDMRS